MVHASGATSPPDLDQACQGGQLGSCVGLGVLYWEGAGVAEDRDKARNLLEQACNGGEEAGCRIRDGLTGEKSQASVTTGSDLTLDPGAAARKQVLVDTIAGPNGPEAAQAAEMMKQLCDGGNMEGCAGLGALYWKGMGVPKDLERGRQLLNRACQGGDTNGCTLLSVLSKESP